MSSSTEDNLKEREVRLFPSIRISSVAEAEVRATSSLLAIVRAVSEFGRSFVRIAGGPSGKLSCYTEVTFKKEGPESAGELRTDGIVRVVRGKTEWKAIVEVKVGDNPLDQSQFDEYHKLAKEESFNAFITISNQAALPNGLPRLSIDRHRLKSVPVVHFSWERLLSEAQVLSRRKEIEDPDQHWMLDEWIRYVADPTSRIIEPPHLGEHWNEILRAAREGNLSSVSKYLEEIIRRWDGFLRKAALRLRAKLGVEVQPKISRGDRSDPAARMKRLHSEALKSGQLSGILRVPDAAGDITVNVLLPARMVRYEVELKPPSEGRATTRINWLLRQLRTGDVPSGLIIKILWDHGRLQSQARIADALSEAGSLLRDGQQQLIPHEAFPRTFVLEWVVPLQKGRGRSSAPVLEGIAGGFEQFYGRVVEQLRPYVPRAPQLPSDQTTDTSTELEQKREGKIEGLLDAEGPAPQDRDASKSMPERSK